MRSARDNATPHHAFPYAVPAGEDAELISACTRAALAFETLDLIAVVDAVVTVSTFISRRARTLAGVAAKAALLSEMLDCDIASVEPVRLRVVKSLVADILAGRE